MTARRAWVALLLVIAMAVGGIALARALDRPDRVEPPVIELETPESTVPPATTGTTTPPPTEAVPTGPAPAPALPSAGEPEPFPESPPSLAPAPAPAPLLPPAPPGDEGDDPDDDIGSDNLGNEDGSD